LFGWMLELTNGTVHPRIQHADVEERIVLIVTALHRIFSIRAVIWQKQAKRPFGTA